MKVINVNDIEDLIINKYFIEQKLLEDGIIEQKHTLQEFISKYAKVDLIYKFKSINIPFGINEINNEKYLFVVTDDKNLLDILMRKLKLIKYDLNNLTRVDYMSLMKNENLKEEDFIIKDAEYYK
jgi:hypothetical protein